MKKLLYLFLALIFISSSYSQSIYKGLNYGMSKSEAKKEFKKNKTNYTTIDIGNNFFYRIYRQNFIFDNNKLVGIPINPKGFAFGMGYDVTVNYLTHTRGFFESLGYETFIDNKWYNAPLNYLKSSSKWGLVLKNKEKNTIIQMFPMSMGSASSTYLVKLIIWDYNTWMGYYDKENKSQNAKAKSSGF
jgi:hypothetical protein